MRKCLFRITVIIISGLLPLCVVAQTRLLSQEAMPRPKAIKIAWQTINEHHTDRFFLLSGTDTIYSVRTVGESAEIQHYAFVHRLKADSTNSYQLLLRHQDGRIQTFPTLSATALAARDWDIYPNPTTGIIHIDPKQYDEVPVSFQIYDVIGREQLSGTFPAFNTRNVIDLRFTARPNGIYYLMLSDGQDRRVFKIILN